MMNWLVKWFTRGARPGPPTSMSGTATPMPQKPQHWRMSSARAELRLRGWGKTQQGWRAGKDQDEPPLSPGERQPSQGPTNKTVLDQGLKLQFGDFFHKKPCLMVHKSVGEGDIQPMATRNPGLDEDLEAKTPEFQICCSHWPTSLPHLASLYTASWATPFIPTTSEFPLGPNPSSSSNQLPK